jgi:hypothetical protein
VFHNSWNSSVVLPANFANVFNLSHHFVTASLIVIANLLTAVHHFSDAIHTDVIAADIQAMSQAVNQTTLPVQAIFSINVVISDSVAAKLFHRSTIAEPNLSTSL